MDLGWFQRGRRQVGKVSDPAQLLLYFKSTYKLFSTISEKTHIRGRGRTSEIVSTAISMLAQGYLRNYRIFLADAGSIRETTAASQIVLLLTVLLRKEATFSCLFYLRYWSRHDDLLHKKDEESYLLDLCSL